MEEVVDHLSVPYADLIKLSSRRSRCVTARKVIPTLLTVLPQGCLSSSEGRSMNGELGVRRAELTGCELTEWLTRNVFLAGDIGPSLRRLLSGC